MPRVKKLTDYAYSPTNPASEDAIREQIDDSIQETYDAAAKVGDTMDLTTNQTVVTGVKTFAVSPIVPTPTTEFQAGTKKYTDDAIAGAVIGELPEGSVTNPFLGSDVKVGSLALLATTLKTDVVSAINEVDSNVDSNTTNILANTNGVNQSLNPIIPDSVVSQAITVTTPSATNKKFTLDIQTTITGGPITINRDSGGALNLKNPDGTDVEELSQDTRFFDVIDDTTVFTLAPKGGAVVKSVQRGEFLMDNNLVEDIIISEVDLNSSIVKITTAYPILVSGNDEIVAMAELLNSTTLRLERGTVDGALYVSWEVVEFNNVKSLQKGTELLRNNDNESIVISSVDLNKSIVFASLHKKLTHQTRKGKRLSLFF